MRRVSALLALGLTAALLTVVPTATPASADTVVSSDQARFDTYTRLAREDFEGSKLPSASLRDCGIQVVSSTSTTPCYDPGVIAPGVELGTPSDDTFGVGVATAGYFSTPTTTVALSYQYVDSLMLRFSTRVDTVGFRVIFDAAGTCGLVVTYADGSPSLTRSLTCSTTAAFVGIEADRPIASVTLTSDGAEIIDDLAFGVRAVSAPPRIVVRAPSVDRRAGTAVLPVTVPGIGTTTVSGPGIRTASLDSARPRTLVLPVVARGAAAKKLRRKGRVTVRVTVTYRPNGGRPVSVVKPVTLVKKKRR